MQPLQKCLAAAVVLICGGAPALAQSTAGTAIVVVTQDGGQHKVFNYGWKGISATTVFDRDAPYDKATVKIVCARECPKKLPTKNVGEDTVTWATGQPTVGKVDGVFCDDLDRCALQQGDRQRDWKEVAYVQFAPR
jgi:hypothetical protein